MLLVLYLRPYGTLGRVGPGSIDWSRLYRKLSWGSTTRSQWPERGRCSCFRLAAVASTENCNPP
eukprot:scaffold123321_cov48-Phaeocystis_antarctica.AAC.1